MSTIPILFTSDDNAASADIKFGKTNYGSASALPVPLPPEVAEEFDTLQQIREVEFYQTGKFRVLNYGGTERLVVDETGDTKTGGTIQINGNQIKSSSGTTALTLSGANVQVAGSLSVGTTLAVTAGATIGGNIAITGTISAAAKFFDIPHPSVEGKRLRHASLEGPENAVYFRGKSTNGHVLKLPSYWKNLVDHNTVTVQLTATQPDQDVSGYYAGYDEILIFNNMPSQPYYYLVMAERRDIEPLTVEYHGTH